MSDDSFDDGLIHSHRWAQEPARRPVPVIVAEGTEEYDDGLVHSHDWARS